MVTLRSRWAVAALLALTVALPTVAFAKKANVKITNRSDWDIHHFFMSSTESDEWGPDQLGDDVIGSGQSFTLQNVPCDSYDIRLIDEDGDECVLGGVDVCGADQGWVITNDDLLQCEQATGN